jgi:NTE family protein
MEGDPKAAVEAVEEDRTTRNRGIGLCLSGGGFRATLFHLGVIRRLFELGITARTDFDTVPQGEASRSKRCIEAAGAREWETLRAPHLRCGVVRSRERERERTGVLGPNVDDAAVGGNLDELRFRRQRERSKFRCTA